MWRPRRPISAKPAPIPAIIPTTIAINVKPAWIGEKPSPSWANSETQSSSPPNAPEERERDEDPAGVGAVGQQSGLDQRIAPAVALPYDKRAEQQRARAQEVGRETVPD
jgi:hypothetical protein